MEKIHKVSDTQNEHIYCNVYHYEEEEAADKRPIHCLNYIKEGFVRKMKCANCGFYIVEHESCFACSGCSYTAHKRCASLPDKISGHPCAPGGCSLTRVTCPSLETNASCYYCREVAHDDIATLAYTSFGTTAYDDLLIHATCALLPLPAIRTDQGRRVYDSSNECNYICHRRPMSAVQNEKETVGSLCFSCGVPQWGTQAYRCKAWPRCKIFFHKSCAELPRKWILRHTSLKHGHGLKLVVTRPETCTACDKKGCRHVYYCEQRTSTKSDIGCYEFVLGEECAYRGTTLVGTSHEHTLFLAEGRPSTFRCAVCRKSLSGYTLPFEVQRTLDLSFRCELCIFNLHFLCGPLPSAAKFSCHIHPLLLIDLLVEDDSGEYYCDVCEEERDLQFRVYHCAECKFVAHVHCLLPEIVKFISFENTATNVELLILGEGSRYGSSGILGEELFFSGIVDRLTEEEMFKRACMISDSSKYYPYDQGRPPMNFEDDSILISKLYTLKDKMINQGRRLMSFLDGNKEHKMTDVDIAEEFFQLDSIKFSVLCSMIFDWEPGIVFQLKDKYGTMKVVDVGGYMVPWALASDLRMLLRKYGDLGGDSTLTTQMKSYATTLLCTAVNKMRNTMARDMSIDDVKYLLFYLTMAKKIAGYKIMESDCFQDSILTTFLGYEAIRFNKDANRRLDLKIAELEAELQNRKAEREKIKECISTQSDFMKECLRRAAGSKWKTIYKLI